MSNCNNIDDINVNIRRLSKAIRNNDNSTISTCLSQSYSQPQLLQFKCTRTVRNAFVKSASDGRDDIIRYLLDLNIDYDIRNTNHDTAYQIASDYGRSSVVQLLRNNAITNGIQKFKFDSLLKLRAIYGVNDQTLFPIDTSNQVQYSRQLYSLHVKILSSDLQHSTICGLIHKSSGLFERLIAVDVTIECIAEQYIKFNELIVDITSGNTKKIDKLILNRVNVNVGNRYGLTPIMLAAINPDLSDDVISTLVNANANVNAIDRCRFTALMYGVRTLNTKAIDVLIKCKADTSIINRANENALLSAAGFDSFERSKLHLIKLLIQHTDDLDYAGGMEGKTALYYAVNSRDPLLVRYLVNLKANINHVCHRDSGHSPLTKAIETGDARIIKEVLDLDGVEVMTYERNDIVIRLINTSTRFPRDVSKSLIMKLIEIKANINAVDKATGYTALHTICRDNDSQNMGIDVAAMLELGADITITTNTGITTLMAIIMNRHDNSYAPIGELLKFFDKK